YGIDHVACFTARGCIYALPNIPAAIFAGGLSTSVRYTLKVPVLGSNPFDFFRTIAGYIPSPNASDEISAASPSSTAAHCLSDTPTFNCQFPSLAPFTCKTGVPGPTTCPSCANRAST